MNNLTELRPSDLLVHSSFIDSQFDPFDDLLSSQRQTNITIDVPSNTSNISNDTSITESIIKFIQEELLSLPKDSFVSKLIDKCQNAHCEIDDIRYALLEIAKCQHNFPYLNATLKKRLCPRKPNGESVENKLGSDCYALYLASLGEYTEDLRLTLNTRSHTQSARKMSTADENNQTHSSEFSQNLCLKETLVRIEREINTLKGDYTQEIEYLNKTVSVLVRENKQLVNANQKNNDRLRNFQNQISSLRENNENLAKTVNNMSVVTHEAEMTCKSNKLAIEKSSGTFRNKLDEYENSIQQLTTDVNKIKNDFKTVKLDVNELRSSVKSESCRINQLSDTRAQGVVSLKTKTNIMSDKLKEFDDELKKVNIDCCSHAKSISDLRKRIINTEKDVKVLDKSTKSYADILKSKSEQVKASAEALDNCNVIESDLSQSKEPIQRNSINEHSNSLVDSHTKHVRSSDVTNLSVLVKDIHAQSNIVNPAPSTSIENKIKNTNNNITGNEQNTNIQVHFPTSMCNPTTVDNFRGFVKKTRHRVSRFYVGGIDKHNSCEESMREYLAARGVNVTHLRYFDKQNRRTASAQLNIDAQCETLIRDPSFWPEGIFLKEWLPWSVFLSTKTEHP